jgi:hypothetical protein
MEDKKLAKTAKTTKITQLRQLQILNQYFKMSFSEFGPGVNNGGNKINNNNKCTG